MIGIDLFCGAGGMSIGAEKAGIKVKVAVENDPSAAQTFSKNHAGTQLIVGDISRIQHLELVDRTEPLVVFGGPPCQGFSTSNQRTRTKENPNNWLFEEFMRHVRLLSPEFVVIENVRGLVETENGDFLEMICNQISNLGYSVHYKVLNAANFGVPQKRSRLFIIASKELLPSFPESKTTPAVTVWDAIGDLPVLENGADVSTLRYGRAASSEYAKKMRANEKMSQNNIVSKNAKFVVDRYKHIPQGGNWANIPDSLMSNYKDQTRCHTGIYRRLIANEPSVVIGNFRKNMLVHPTQDRGLSVREAARIQSFPDSFVFSGSIGFQQQQVGNAVPPLLAQSVFEKLVNI
jgi:DNA (cytosine-5)-methyltransferase 1